MKYCSIPSLRTLSIYSSLKSTSSSLKIPHLRHDLFARKMEQSNPQMVAWRQKIDAEMTDVTRGPLIRTAPAAQGQVPSPRKNPPAQKWPQIVTLSPRFPFKKRFGIVVGKLMTRFRASRNQERSKTGETLDRSQSQSCHSHATAAESVHDTQSTGITTTAVNIAKVETNSTVGAHFPISTL